MLEGRYEFFEHDVIDPAGDGPMIPETRPLATEGSDRKPAAV